MKKKIFIRKIIAVILFSIGLIWFGNLGLNSNRAIAQPTGTIHVALPMRLIGKAVDKVRNLCEMLFQKRELLNLGLGKSSDG